MRKSLDRMFPFRGTAEQHQMLQQIADACGLSVSDILRFAVRDFLANPPAYLTVNKESSS